MSDLQTAMSEEFMYGPRATTPGSAPTFNLDLADELAPRPASAPVPPGLVSFMSTPVLGRSRSGLGATSEADESEGPESPTRFRMKNLGGRMSDLQQGINHEKQARREAWETQLRSLEERLQRVATSDGGKFKDWLDQVAVIRKTLGAEKQSLEMMGEQQCADTKATESRLGHDINQHKAMRSETIDRLKSSTVGPEARVMEDLKYSKTNRAEGENQRNLILSEETQKLHSDADSIARARDASGTHFAQTLSDQMHRLQDKLMQERKNREQGEKSLQAMADEVLGGLKRTIAQQRQQRENMEETLLKLLEEIAGRVEVGIQTGS